MSIVGIAFDSVTLVLFTIKSDFLFKGDGDGDGDRDIDRLVSIFTIDDDGDDEDGGDSKPGRSMKFSISYRILAEKLRP